MNKLDEEQKKWVVNPEYKTYHTAALRLWIKILLKEKGE